VTELSNPAEGSCSTIGSVVMVAHLLKIEIRRYLGSVSHSVVT